MLLGEMPNQRNHRAFTVNAPTERNADMARKTFTLTIDTSNAAFHDECDGAYWPEQEVTRLLKEAARQIAQSNVSLGETGWHLLDYNGNAVGRYDFTGHDEQKD